VQRIEFTSFVNDLLDSRFRFAILGNRVVDVPLPHALQRVIAGQDPFVPDLQEAAGVRINESSTRMKPPHAARAFLPGGSLLGIRPGAAVIL